MREYWILVKIQLLSLFGINSIRHASDEAEKKRARKNILLLLVMAIALGNVSVTYGLMLFSALAGAERLVLELMITGISAFLLLISMFSVRGVLYAFKDYDLVMSWPVPRLCVAASRITTCYAYNLLYGILFVLPLLVLYAMKVRPSVAFYLLSPVFLLLVPAAPTAIGGLVGTALTALTARMKKNSLVNTALQMILFVGIMALSMNVGNGIDRISENAAAIGGAAGRYYPLADWFQAALSEGDPVSAGLFILTSLLLMGLFSLVAAKALFPISSRILSASEKEPGRVKQTVQARTRSLRATLFYNEWKRYLSSSIYVTNTAFGALMLLILTGAAAIKGPERIEMMHLDADTVLATLPLVMGMMAAFSATTSCAISMEGPRIDIVKSLPVPAKDWLKSKMNVSLAVILPAIVVSATGIGLAFRAKPLLFACLYLVPTAYALFFAAFGLWINLLLPKLDWANEAEAVKQSMSTFVAVMAGMALAGIPIGVLALTGSEAVLPATAGVLAALFFGVRFLLLYRAEERLRRLK